MSQQFSAIHTIQKCMHMWIECTRMFTATLLIKALKYINNKVLINENKLIVTTCKNMHDSHKDNMGPKRPYQNNTVWLCSYLGEKQTKPITMFKCAYPQAKTL